MGETTTAGDAELLVTAAPTSGWGTVYSRTGDWFPGLCLALLLVAVAGVRRQVCSVMSKSST
ncbi:hypothetical protein [Micromonospora sp. NPDC048898]|uniref:hypothetical protein n=1 Tax=Micromonospora sp. NPDC048898 TaxID=3364260 RepID=UPI0037190596